jgi:hypothetical protein
MKRPGAASRRADGGHDTRRLATILSDERVGRDPEVSFAAITAISESVGSGADEYPHLIGPLVLAAEAAWFGALLLHEGPNVEVQRVVGDALLVIKLRASPDSHGAMQAVIVHTIHEAVRIFERDVGPLREASREEAERLARRVSNILGSYVGVRPPIRVVVPALLTTHDEWLWRLEPGAKPRGADNKAEVFARLLGSVGLRPQSIEALKRAVWRAEKLARDLAAGKRKSRARP